MTENSASRRGAADIGLVARRRRGGARYHGQEQEGFCPSDGDGQRRDEQPDSKATPEDPEPKPKPQPKPTNPKPTPGVS